MIRRVAALSSLLLFAMCAAQEDHKTTGPHLRAQWQRTFAEPDGILRQIRFSADSKLLAISNTNGLIELRDLQRGAIARRLKHEGGVTAIAFSRDGRHLVSAGYAGTLVLWRVADGVVTRTWKAHEHTIWAVAFSPDAQSIASAGEDKTVKLWRTSDGALRHTLTGHALNVWSIAFAPDSQHVASSSFDHTVKIWNVASGGLERTLTDATQAVVSIDISPDGKWIAGGGDDSTTRVWRLADGRLVHALKAGSNHIYSVAFSPDSQWLAAAGREKGALGTLWKQVTGNRFRRGYDPTVRLWRVADGVLQQALADHADDVVSVAFSPDGNWLATASEDNTVRLYALQRR